MALGRIYADSDGKSDFEDLPCPDSRELQPAAGISWRRFEPNQLVAWHTPSRRAL